ncbi:hypothetical protein [Pedobacter ginsengisoli]|uniref:hypothetical protein n=1 Tax=Pedobacter ginsengisoli TaxID=363852 RepID=UPI00254ACE43|nr:hypothetical protein [Pedobacter ginsengisoli]
MKTLFLPFITSLFAISGFAQDTLLRSSLEPVLRPSYNIGKSKDPEIYPADSIPLFVIKGGGKSERIRPAKILEVETKGNNLYNAIPSGFIKEIFILGGKSMPGKYRKEGTHLVWEIYLINDKAREAFKFLKDKGYTK